MAVELDKLDELTKIPYFKGRTYELSPGDPETFEISAIASKSAVRRVLRFTLVSGGRQSVLEVRDSDGSPFRTTGPAQSWKAYEAFYTECSGKSDDDLCARAHPEGSWVRAKKDDYISHFSHHW